MPVSQPKDCKMTVASNMQIEMWTLDRIREYENNPRNNDDAVAASIKEYGFSQSIVVDSGNPTPLRLVEALCNGFERRLEVRVCEGNSSRIVNNP
jgi:hypothetical protein